MYIPKGPAARIATVPLWTGAAGHCTRLSFKGPVSCGVPARIPEEFAYFSMSFATYPIVFCSDAAADFHIFVD